MGGCRGNSAARDVFLSNASPSELPWQIAAPGVILTVRLTPRGGRDAVDGLELRSDGQCVLKARVRAAPTGGEANDALVMLIARTLSVPPRDVSLVAGATSRIKRLAIAGDGPTLAAALEKAIGARDRARTAKLDKAR